MPKMLHADLHPHNANPFVEKPTTVLSIWHADHRFLIRTAKLAG